MATLTIQYSGTTYRIKATTVSISGRRSIDANPNANISGPVEVQTLAYENMKITVQGIHFDGVGTTVTQSLLNTMITSKYDGSNPGILVCKYGPSNSEISVVGSDGSTSIPVVLESYTFVPDTVESRNAKIPAGTMVFTETVGAE